MRNSPDRAENSGRLNAFSATGWTDFELIRYNYKKKTGPLVVDSRLSLQFINNSVISLPPSP
ncbi:MAG: hypothetical protein FWC73_02720 [Defluviitaleaceae bacterium]|nr:hypothetical protein [Defluviitaleaceae bacterium]